MPFDRVTRDNGGRGDDVWKLLALAVLFVILLALVFAPDASRKIILRFLTHRRVANIKPVWGLRETLAMDFGKKLARDARVLSVRGREFISPLGDEISFADKCTLRYAELVFDKFVELCVFGASSQRIELCYKKIQQVVETARRFGESEGCPDTYRAKCARWSTDVGEWAERARKQVDPLFAKRKSVNTERT